jgi:hypothetical protein
MTTKKGAFAPGDDENFPGFEYAQRVTASTIRALAAHGEEINDAFMQIRRGTYDANDAMAAWTRLAENYYAIFAELMRGPSPIARPAWLIIPYSKKKPPSPIFSTPIEGNVDKRTPLACTKFEAVGGDRSGLGILDGPPEAAGGRVQIRLNDKAIQKLAVDSDHVGFIFRQGVGRIPPLVIVVLRVIA